MCSVSRRQCRQFHGRKDSVGGPRAIDPKARHRYWSAPLLEQADHAPDLVPGRLHRCQVATVRRAASNDHQFRSAQQCQPQPVPQSLELPGPVSQRIPLGIEERELLHLVHAIAFLHPGAQAKTARPGIPDHHHREPRRSEDRPGDPAHPLLAKRYGQPPLAVPQSPRDGPSQPTSSKAKRDMGIRVSAADANAASLPKPCVKAAHRRSTPREAVITRELHAHPGEAAGESSCDKPDAGLCMGPQFIRHFHIGAMDLDSHGSLLSLDCWWNVLRPPDRIRDGDRRQLRADKAGLRSGRCETRSRRSRR